MAKLRGPIGYAIQRETAPGVWEDVVEEHICSAQLLRSAWSTRSSDGVNDDLKLSNKISVLMNQYTNNPDYRMNYIYFRGIRWRIESIEEVRPRLILTLGGVYNGPTP